MRSLLRNGNFVRLFAGRVVTNVGDSLYFVAAMWLVYDLTGDSLYSGIAGFLTLAPSALQALFGPLVDRWPLRHILVGTQVVQGVLILVIPLAAYYGYLSVWLVLAVMPLLSLLNQFVYPAQSAALPRLVERDELVAANSAFSLAYQGVDAVANAVGGVLIALSSATVLFLVDSVTFAAAALLFAGVVVPPAGATGEDADATAESDAATTAAAADGDGAVATDGGDDSTRADEGAPGDADEDASAAADEDAPGDADAGAPDGYLDSLREGFGYVRGTVLTGMLAGAAVVNFAVSGATMAALPAFADSLGGPTAYGVLMASIAAGLFVGALGASLVRDRPFGPLTVVSFLVSGALWVAAVAASWLPLTALLLGLALVPIGASNVLISAMVQSAVPETLLGRVSAVLGSASTVAIPIGALLGGALSSVVGPALLLGVGGVALALLAVYWLVHPDLRALPAIDDVDTLVVSD